MGGNPRIHSNIPWVTTHATLAFFDEDHAIEMCIRWTGKDPSRFDELVIPLDERPKVGIGGILIR